MAHKTACVYVRPECQRFKTIHQRSVVFFAIEHIRECVCMFSVKLAETYFVFEGIPTKLTTEAAQEKQTHTHTTHLDIVIRLNARGERIKKQIYQRSGSALLRQANKIL